MKVNVYFPDALYQRMKAHRLNVSAICQRAMLAEIEKLENLTWIEVWEQ